MQATFNHTSPLYKVTLSGVLTASVNAPVIPNSETTVVPIVSGGVSEARVQQLIDLDNVRDDDEYPKNITTTNFEALYRSAKL